MEKRVSLTITVFNEYDSIVDLLESILKQSKLPNEVIIVDGGSKDKTISLIKKFIKEKNKQKLFKLILRQANRPEGRNLAIEKAKNEIIAITDAGCVLDNSWVKEITKPFMIKNVEVVSGYYKADTMSIFERCVAAYTLVMPDKIDPKEFMPSARSMAMLKSVWKKSGKFPESFPLNEDYVFAHRLKKLGKKFYFTRKAIVYWKPRENLRKSIQMFYYFAKGDASARIIRPKVLLIFARYILGLLLLLQSLVFILLVPLYFSWAILKNYKYVKNWRALIYLPILQISSDLAIMAGTIWGIQKKQ